MYNENARSTSGAWLFRKFKYASNNHINKLRNTIYSQSKDVGMCQVPYAFVRYAAVFLSEQSSETMLPDRIWHNAILQCTTTLVHMYISRYFNKRTYYAQSNAQSVTTVKDRAAAGSVLNRNRTNHTGYHRPSIAPLGTLPVFARWQKRERTGNWPAWHKRQINVNHHERAAILHNVLCRCWTMQRRCMYVYIKHWYSLNSSFLRN